ncbi:DUF1593 domain-containing protein [Fulvivirgaceae bacterium BMA12]|uniref:DUF1593 domain-containing protein n=1 Tax=Agaribacillus aureus TaxID=3051825 RepID=A0ABT8KZ40_9BACT|nr:DUF1593 domain-containing protein [Fulvivirgaceae bacterium BMA12]
MRRFFIVILMFCGTSTLLLAQQQNQRLIILADMGNEPDEEQQMVHMLMYANEFDLEGLIAVTGKYLRKGTRPDLFFELIDGYDRIVENLKKHDTGWPTPGYLKSIVVRGQERYGIAATGIGRTSPGSRLIVRALEKDDPRPIYIVINAGSNTLAQALIDYEATHSQEEFNRALNKIRVYENGSQDNAGAWICHQYPDIHWIRSNYQTYCYAGPSGDGGKDNKGNKRQLGPYTWEPYAYNGIGQHQWALEHIKGGHGPLGKGWPIRQFGNGGIIFMEGGGTIPWLGLVNKGLYDIEYPQWGGWSGRFSREKVENYWSKHADIRVDEKNTTPFFVFKEEADSWIDPETGEEYKNHLFAPIWRWRRAFFNDFKGRMDWCVKDYGNANHNPLAVINGDKSDKIIFIKAEAGKKLDLEASGSTDPDEDRLFYSWYYYKEAGTYLGNLVIHNADSMQASVIIPKDAKDKQLHVILEVRDNNKIVSMYDYRRLVIEVD